MPSETLDIINVSLSNGRSFFMNIFARLVSNLLYENGKAVHEIMDDDEHLCADPLSLSGGASCCSGYQQEGLGMCEYFGEVLLFHAAKQRCDAASAQGHISPSAGRRRTGTTRGYAAIFTWLDTPCQVQVQVHPTGWVNLVHSPLPSATLPSTTRICSVFAGSRVTTLALGWLWHVRNAR